MSFLERLKREVLNPPSASSEQQPSARRFSRRDFLLLSLISVASGGVAGYYIGQEDASSHYDANYGTPLARKDGKTLVIAESYIPEQVKFKAEPAVIISSFPQNALSELLNPASNVRIDTRETRTIPVFTDPVLSNDKYVSKLTLNPPVVRFAAPVFGDAYQYQDLNTNALYISSSTVEDIDYRRLFNRGKRTARIGDWAVLVNENGNPVYPDTGQESKQKYFVPLAHLFKE